MPSKIEDYALIGDCETAALVDRNGSIDWLCWPIFSSEACFASLLGTEDNGYWRIAPAGSEWTTTRRYRDHTLILETTFEHADGAVRLTDFMPIRGNFSDVVRIVEGIRGTLDMRMELALRFDYGRTIPWVTGTEDGVRAIAGPNLAILHASVPVHGENLKTVADFTVTQGDRLRSSLTYGTSYEGDPPRVDPERALQETHEFLEQVDYPPQLRRQIPRPHRTLPGHAQSHDLPAHGRGRRRYHHFAPRTHRRLRNWDYRYCWLRDTTFTLLALTNGGYFDEASAWQDWLLRALAGQPRTGPDHVRLPRRTPARRVAGRLALRLRIQPGPRRQRRRPPGSARHLRRGARLLLSRSAGHGPPYGRRFPRPLLLLEHLETIWREPDEGIWEIRGDAQQFTYSKMMCWVAFDRAVMLAQQLDYQAPSRNGTQSAGIHDQICERAFNTEKNAFVQAYGSDHSTPACSSCPWLVSSRN